MIKTKQKNLHNYFVKKTRKKQGDFQMLFEDILFERDTNKRECTFKCPNRQMSEEK